MLKRALGLDLTLDIRCCDDWTFNIFTSSHISYFTVSAWIFSRQQIKYGSYFFRYLYDITTWDDDMTWRCHETCSGHGVMSRAAWQHRDTTWRGCNECSQCHCPAIVQLPLHCLQYQSLPNMMGTFHKSHGLTGSFICPHALNTRSGVRDQISDDGCAMDMGRGDVTSDNETCVGVTTERGQWSNGEGQHCQQRETQRWCDTAWHVTSDVWCAHWHPTSLTGWSLRALCLLIAWLLRPCSTRRIIRESLPKYSLFL